MSQTKICRYCGSVIYSDQETCEYCGKYLLKEHDNEELFCSKCKAPVNTDDNFCQKCGAVFNLNFNREELMISRKHNMSEIHYNIGILITSFILSIALTILAANGKEPAIGQNLIYFSIAFIGIEIFLYIYLLPSIIAIENNNPNIYLIYICNLLLGITVVGWFVALGLAMQSKQKHNKL